MRGVGAFEDYIKVLKTLNSLGYGKNPDLNLNLVYNPSGAMIPQTQEELEMYTGLNY